MISNPELKTPAENLVRRTFLKESALALVVLATPSRLSVPGNHISKKLFRATT